MIRLRWPWASYGTLATFYASTLGTLWASDVPRWRVAVVAGCWLLQAAVTPWFLTRGTAPMTLGTYPPGVLRLGLVHLVTSATAIALTGALGSPLLVTLLMP